MRTHIEWLKRYFSKNGILLFTLLLGACGFSSKQELILSKAVGDYVDAVNNNDAIKLLGMYHPNVVKYHTRNNLDSLKLALESSDRNIVNYRKLEIKSSGDFFLVKYAYPKEKKQENFYAFSQDAANSWIFIEDTDRSRIPLLEMFNN